MVVLVPHPVLTNNNGNNDYYYSNRMETGLTGGPSTLLHWLVLAVQQELLKEKRSVTKA